MKNKKNEVQLGFCIWGFEDITHDELTKIMGIAPYTKIFADSLKPTKENGWILEFEKFRHKSFEDQMNHLLDFLEEKIDILKELSKKYYFEFSCGIYLYDPEESTPWVHLGSRYNKFVKEVNAEIDFDIYV